jgi:hypothetical protein
MIILEVHKEMQDGYEKPHVSNVVMEHGGGATNRLSDVSENGTK